MSDMAFFILHKISLSVRKSLTGSHPTARNVLYLHFSALLRQPPPACLLPVIHNPAKVSRPLSISNS